ncbi:MAG: amidohydrolase family protein, partial [Gemmatimonadaceae bacterium]
MAPTAMAKSTLEKVADQDSAGETKVKRLAIAAAVIAVSGCTGSREPTTAITHVSIVDVVAGATRADNTVIIHGNRIVYAGAATNANIPDGARLIDGRGKFLIPGLWDVHVHAFMYVFSDFAGPLMIANGVTGARDMGYHVDTALRWRRDIAAGLEVGPRLIVGVRADGPVGRASFVSHIKDPADAVRAVDTLARSTTGARRADFISIDPLIPRDAYF